LEDLDSVMPTSVPKIVELPPDTPAKGQSQSVRGKKQQGASVSVKSKQPTSWSWFFFKWSLFTVLLAFGAAQFIAGDLLWGYRGKYVKKQTYFPVSADTCD
jgi:hypothetical protein